MIVTLALLAALCYGASGYLAWRSAPALTWAALAGIGFHTASLALQIFDSVGLRIGINEAVSLFAWQSAVLLWVFCWRANVQIQGLAIYPLAGLFALWSAYLPSPVSDIPLTDWKLALHVLLSVLSAGLLTLAAAQSVALALQDRLLHRHSLAGFSRFPPLQTMEALLFQMIAVGFALLSATLLTGLWFVHDWMAQHLAHKTILSITAWLIFGTLLWGRWRHGWRGRTAIRWALTGYGMLVLAYFGSKFVLEHMLGHHWGT